MITSQLLEELSRRGVSLWVEGDRLRYRGPKGALTPELKAFLGERKPELLLLLGDGRESIADFELPDFAPDPEHLYDPFPMTDLQEAYWLGYSDMFELGNVAPHAYTEHELTGFDYERLNRAWQRMIEHHSMLRSVALPDGRQQILEQVPEHRIPLFDLRGLPPEEQEARLLAVREEMCNHGPAAHIWPLWEMRLFQLEENRFRLCWNASLLLGDGWSYHLLAEEWFQLYRDPDRELTPYEISFRDYVVALKSFESSRAFQQSLAYWRERIPTLPSAPELPLARDPGQLGPLRFQRRSRVVPAEVWQPFREHARRAGVTPSLGLCAAYSEVVAAWSKKRRFTLNILFFNRLPVHPEVDTLMGNFSTTVLLEVDCAAPRTFAQRAAHLQEQMWRDLKHSRVSGVRVLREMARAQGGVDRGIMPVVFASNLRSGFEEQEISHSGVRSIHNHLQTSHVWLDHQVHELRGGLYFNWDTVEGLLPEGMVDDMFAAYCDLLTSLAGEAVWTRPVGALVPGWQLRERAAVNATQEAVSDELLHVLFRRQEALDPDRPAVIAPGRTLSYGELGARAAVLGRRLRELGTRPGELVAVVMDKGWEQAVAALGILESGAAYLPIDPSLPEERLRYLLENGEVRCVVTQPWLEGALPWPPGVQRLTVDADAPAGPEPPLPATQGNGDLAYVIYTSGSTGLPKGVMIDHRGAVNTVLDVNRRFGVGAADRVLALSSLSFDLSVYDLFGPLAAGGAIVFPEAAASRDPGRWADLLERGRVTVWNSVPALMQLLADHLEDEGRTLPEDLRLALLSGDWVPTSLPDRIRALGPGVQVISLGGATEASIWSILHPVGEVDPAWPSIPYGRPMANQTFHVLDERLEPKPVWVPGHLYIGGIGLARGYWRDPEKTGAIFLVHPRTGERLYRTGDLGRYLPGGDIEFLGREDFQVKVQGFRIELGEIEAALAQHPGVRHAVVAAHRAGREDRGGVRLIGYVVPEGDPAPDADDLRRFLHGKLPEHMVPGTFVALPELPLSRNGKVDRSVLPLPGEGRSPDTASYVPPRNEVEAGLARIWEELLGVGPVGVRENFFDLGGHSMLVMQLMARIRKSFGQTLPFAVLLRGATVEHLAAALQGSGSDEAAAVIPLQPRGDRPPFVCVHPSGGDVLCYAELARRLGDGRPFFGVRTPGLDSGAEQLLGTIEEMAASYLRELLARQPGGPYLLGGWSMGGVVAFEMARQLAGQGKRVDLVALIDAAAPATWPAEIAQDDYLEAWFARDLAGLSGRGNGLSLDGLRAQTPERRLEIIREVAQAAGTADVLRLLQVFKTNFRAMLSYSPRPYGGPVVLFRAAAGLGAGMADPGLGWSGLAQGGLAVHEVPGDHYSLVRPPHVEELAARLRQSLEEERTR